MPKIATNMVAIGSTVLATSSTVDHHFQIVWRQYIEIVHFEWRVSFPFNAHQIASKVAVWICEDSD